MTTNYYSASKNNPYHISVGAVVINDNHEVACHYFKEAVLKGRGDYQDQIFKDFYILMRETPEIGETLEEAVYRGLMEEFGIEGRIRTYIGSIRANISSHGFSVEKTTLYFLVDLINFDSSRRSKNDPEQGGEIQWQSLDYLIPKMKEQAIRLNREDADESVILERTKSILMK